MAEINATFDLMSSHEGTVTSETWVDMLAYGDANSPIPSGNQIWLGHATFIAEDKGLIFEIRPNLPGESAGDIASTQLRSYDQVPGGESKDVDLNFYGNIATFAPVGVASTGVEKVWLRIRSGSGSVGAYDYLLFYGIY